MSQILVPGIGVSKGLLVQDLYFVQKRFPIRTTVRAATCTICGKGLDDGVSITVKPIGQKMRLFCQYHMQKE